MNRVIDFISDRLRDSRSKKVIFVSHCILNENTRYLGGAFTQGVLTGLVTHIAKTGYGIVQMQCPEQAAWGGVLKRYIWFSLYSEVRFIQWFKRLCFPIFVSYTRYTYRKLARRVAREMADYQASGYEVVGVVGIDGSPSCGVNTTLDIKSSYDYFSKTSRNDLHRETFNKNLYAECLRKGRGIFTLALKKACEKKGINLKFFSHDLVAEVNGVASETLHI